MPNRALALLVRCSFAVIPGREFPWSVSPRLVLRRVGEDYFALGWHATQPIITVLYFGQIFSTGLLEARFNKLSNIIEAIPL